MTKKEWAACVVALKGFYPTSFRLDEDAIGIWFSALEDLPGPVVQAAIIHMAKTTRAFPSIAEIREYATPKQDHGQAWGEVMREVQRVGHYPVMVNGQLQQPDPQFSDPLTYQAVQALGGWVNLCQTMLVDDVPTWRAQFRRVYEAAADRQAREQTFQQLGIAPPGQLQGSKVQQLKESNR